jgi:uncharacterized protein with HEPN domain/predicted nucleotidyltransferase
VKAKPTSTNSLDREQVLAILAAHQEELRELGVKSLTLFGSVARDEARPDSDVDLLVEFDKPVGLFAFTKLQRRLEQFLGRAVDLGTLDSIRPELHESVSKETVVAMPPRDWRLRIQDILETIAEIEDFTEGMTFESFATDKKTIKAVISNISIIGEAARSKHIPTDVQVRHPEIPWDDMRGIRNKVVHEYFRVELKILWQTIKHDLPPLIPKLQELLDHEAT